MHPAVVTSFESERGCGYRKPGGLYLVSDTAGRDCGIVPFELKTCPCCGEGFKPSRGYRWIDSERILESAGDCRLSATECESCPANIKFRAEMGPAILIWISDKFYPTTDDFNKESNEMGISRRISGDALPRGFQLGETWVFLAHKAAIVEYSGQEEKAVPGVFTIFKPRRIERIVDGSETDAEIDEMVKRGITPVQVFYEAK
jgi:hypothetical protein